MARICPCVKNELTYAASFRILSTPRLGLERYTPDIEPDPTDRAPYGAALQPKPGQECRCQQRRIRTRAQSALTKSARPEILALGRI
jgi:hypothetical protein